MANTADSRAYYLAKIKEAERLSVRAREVRTLESLRMIADGYRTLLGRLGDAPLTKH